MAASVRDDHAVRLRKDVQVEDAPPVRPGACEPMEEKQRSPRPRSSTYSSMSSTVTVRVNTFMSTSMGVAYRRKVVVVIFRFFG